MKKVAISMLLSLSVAHANVDQLLDNIVLGSYYQKPGQIISPNYNTFTAGSFSFRLRQDLINKPVFAFQPPRATLSCAGLDFDAGWLSMMNLDTLNQMLQQAGASFMWGIVVGLIYSLPGISEAFDKLQKWGRYAQLLGQNACQVAMNIGRGLGNMIFHGEAGESILNQLAEGTKSAISEAVKSVKENLNFKKLYGVYPYEVLYNIYSDKDLVDLIASFTGVILWSPVDSSGNLCKSKECAENVRAAYLPPLENNIERLIHGGSGIEVYDCSWGVVDTPSGAVYFCTNANNNMIPTRVLNNAEGLAAKELRYLESILTKVQGDSSLTEDEERYLRTHPVSGLISILNYLAARQKMGLSVDDYLTDLAILSAGLKLKAFIASVRSSMERLAFAYGQDLPTEFVEYKKLLSQKTSRVEKLIDEKTRSIASLQNALSQYVAVRDYIKQKIMQRFGVGALMFGSGQ